MKAVVLSGGSGTRLRPFTFTQAKQLIPVANKPILFYLLEDVKRSGIDDVAIIVGDTREEVKEKVGDGSRFGLNITYVEQEAPLGIAHAVKLTEGFIKDDPFVVILGDNLLNYSIKDLVEQFEKSDSDAHILLTHVKNPERFGVAELDENGNVINLVEKPKQPKSDLALVGIYFFRPIIFEMIKQLKFSWRNELEITDAIDMLVKNGHKVKAEIITGWWKDTGKPEDILDANHLVLDMIETDIQGKVEPGATIKGRVQIGKNSRISKDSYLIGPLVIGENCIIENAYVGSYCAIGDGCHLKNCEIESSIVMQGTKIECKKKLTNCLIGTDCEILESSQYPKGNKLIIGKQSKLFLE
ncbi:MAG: glucose-1-phosphate thymidylyltransferase [Candidatus Helarchaeales archaeon]